MDLTKKPINEIASQAKLRRIAEELVSNPVSAAEKETAEDAVMLDPSSVEVRPLELSAAAFEKKPEPDKAADPDAAVLAFAETLKKRPARPTLAQAGSLDEAAMRFFTILYARDPTWQQRDIACEEEWGLSPAMRVLKYLAIVLDQQLHLNLMYGYDDVSLPQAAPTVAADPLQGICPQCHQTFVRKIAGQVCCSNECGAKHFPRPEPKRNDYDDAFNRFIESQVNQPVMQPDQVRGAGMPMPGNLR